VIASEKKEGGGTDSCEVGAQEWGMFDESVGSRMAKVKKGHEERQQRESGAREGTKQSARSEAGHTGNMGWGGRGLEDGATNRRRRPLAPKSVGKRM